MKTITIHMTWRSSCRVEVEDDFVLSGNLSEIPEDILEEMTADGAELVDWE